MDDRVFIADYIKKKRKRKGNIEYLVKWKGYSTRHCTWEPQHNILDSSLIRQFEEEGYDPCKVRLAARKKKRKRSEVVEFRSLPLPFYDSDTDHDHDAGTPPHALLDKYNRMVAPISLSKYDNGWRTDAQSSYKTNSNINDTDIETHNNQKKRKIESTFNADKENQLDPTTDSFNNDNPVKLESPTSCHPKMRVKRMFREGDFDNVDWGYDWTSSDESVKSPPSTPMSGISDVPDNCTEFNNKRNTENEMDKTCSRSESFTSDTTIAAIDEYAYSEVNCDITEQKSDQLINYQPLDENAIYYEPLSPYEEIDDTPSLTNQTNDPSDYKINDDVIADKFQHNTETECDIHKESRTFENMSSHLHATEITMDNITVVIQECDKMKGFFKFESL